MDYTQKIKSIENYNFLNIEKKWRETWDSESIFNENSDKKKFYLLEMFPYPSGNLHMGHVLNYTIGDVIARYKRRQGYNVLRPMGWDAFGLPAENAAIERGLNPKDWTYSNIENMKSQYKKLGFSVDWSREIVTCDPDYYKYEQKFFIDFFKKGIAYQKESIINWDPVDKTVLANEQVVDGKGWRSGAVVEKKSLTQWFMGISKYSDKLLSRLDSIKWPNKTVLMQKNWIGKSRGAEIDFKLAQSLGDITHVRVFTTRPDTIYGASFIGISPMHPIAKELGKSNQEIEKFAQDSMLYTEDKEKIGLNTGLYVAHPFLKDVKLPIYIANFILIDYGTGAIFGCPAHDERDFEFAKKYGLPINQVVVLAEKKDDFVGKFNKEAFVSTDTENCVMINSFDLDGLNVEDAKNVVIRKISDLGIGCEKYSYRLRDWCVSRQRYWGCPIPMVYCDHCGIVPEKYENLPIKLPEDVLFDGRGNPLENHPTWKHCKCPNCGIDATRETDTLDTFFESSWYFLSFCDCDLTKAKLDRLMSVDQYIGGSEHSVMHLLYARFFMIALAECGYVDDVEPFQSLLHQGMVCHKTFKLKSSGAWVYPSHVEMRGDSYFLEGTNEEIVVGESIKMSKSKKNVIDPVEMVETYGADAVRLFVLSDSPPDRDLEWSNGGIDSAYKYINRLWKTYIIIRDLEEVGQIDDDLSKSLKKMIHKTIKSTQEEYEKIGTNKVIALIRALHNKMDETRYQSSYKNILSDALLAIINIMNPIIPHITGEIGKGMGLENLIHHEWPEFDQNIVSDDVVTIAIQVNGKLRGTFDIAKNSKQDEYKEFIFKNDYIRNNIKESDIKKIIIIPGKIVNIVV
jgi:leucyl-tRNA synthetase